MRLDPHFGMLPTGAFEHCGDRRIRLHGGGGGIPIVDDALDLAGDAASSVGNAVSDVAGGVGDVVSDVAGGVGDVMSDVAGGVGDLVQDAGELIDDAASSVGDVLSDVGDAVGDVLESAVEAIDNTVTAALDDPVNTAIRVAAFTFGGPAGLAAANAAISLSQGASLSDAAVSGAKSYALAQLGAQAGGYASSAAQGAGAASEFIPFAQGAGSGFATSALTGQDPLTGALVGGINSGGNALMKNAINGPSTSGGLSSIDSTDQGLNENGQADSFTYKPISDINSSPISYGLEGTSAGLKATMDPSAFNLDGSVNYGLSPLNAAGIGLQPSMSPNIKKMNGAQGLTGTDSGGTYSALGYTPFDASPNLGDPKSFINDPNTLGRNVAITDTSSNIPLPKVNFAGMLGLGATNSSNRPSTNLQSRNTPESYGSAKLLAGNGLEGDSTGDPYYLQRLKQLYGSITPEMQTSQLSNEPSSPLTMASGGSADSSTTTENPFPIAQTGITRGPLVGGGQRKVAQLAPLQQLKTQIAQPRMAKGGLPAKYAEALPEGHKPEFITGLTGYYASGKGTGQSDDIDAMLHDGDYVADADLVAALGDGSSKAGAEALEKFRRQIPHQQHAEGGTAVAAKIADGEYVFPASFVTAIGQGDNKAGAKILDKMREAIRAHKRSAPTTKIPPKAKSPLEYLKMAKG